MANIPRDEFTIITQVIIEILKQRNVKFYHNLPLLIRIHTTLLANKLNMNLNLNVSRNAFLNSRSEEKNIFFDVHTGLKQIKMWFFVVCTLIDNGYASLLFSQTIFSYCFCMLSEFAKVFEKKDSDAYK